MRGVFTVVAIAACCAAVFAVPAALGGCIATVIAFEVPIEARYIVSVCRIFETDAPYALNCIIVISGPEATAVVT